MPEKKRTFESELDLPPSPRLQPRPAKRAETDGQSNLIVGTPKPRANSALLSRDLVLRLINHLKKA